MLKTVHDHAGFAEATATLQRLEVGQAALHAEQAGIRERNKTGSNRQEGASVQQQALAALDGKLPPQGELTADQKRLTEIAGALQLFGPALHRQPLEAEYARIEARAQALDERAADVAAINKKWVVARTALAAALSAENELIDELLEGGFGRHYPTVTSPRWLSRDSAMRDLGITPRYP
jgi:hypothetical protein